MNSPRSALLLTLMGLLAAGFFYVTDPTIGLARHVIPSNLSLLDAAHQAWPGTLVGLSGSAVVILTGIWLLFTRRA